MLKYVLAVFAALAVSACGTQMGDRMASGAAIGGGAGLLVGGIGAIPGALVGAGMGAFTDPDEVNLGEPVWDDAAEARYNNQGKPK
jgi:branched-subunit amino acid ABC-type transport system permease component